jgi:serine/threonine protein kinase
VDQGWLTPFQLKRIRAGQGRGLTLGQYRLLDELGRGGFGCVYRAMHGIMNRVVALKVISPALVEDTRARTWFRREVLAMTQLYHPNIVMAYDANEVDDTLFLVMEYVEGPNLDQKVRQQGPMPIGLACGMMHQVGRALQYAHEKGMVHRDIKPANLLIPRSQAVPVEAGAGSAVLVKVVDFGLARLHGKGSSSQTLQLNNDKGFVGTPAYISPEQARNVHDVDIRSDLYSLGCTFYFALTGKSPFSGKTPVEIVIQHLEKEAVPLTSLRPEIPPALASIVRRLMAKKPEQRFQTPADLIAELNFLCGSLPAQFQVASAVACSPTVDREPEPPVTVVVPVAPEQPSEAHSVEQHHLIPPAEQVAVTEVADESLEGEDLSEPAGNAQAADLPQEVAGAGKACWNEWLAVLTAVTEGKQPAIGPSAYRAVHSQLTAWVRAEAGRQGTASAWRGLETLVTPWLTLETLASTDRATLVDMHQRCHGIGRRLGLMSKPWTGWGWPAGVEVRPKQSVGGFARSVKTQG